MLQKESLSFHHFFPISLCLFSCECKTHLSRSEYFCEIGALDFHRDVVQLFNSCSTVAQSKCPSPIDPFHRLPLAFFLACPRSAASSLFFLISHLGKWLTAEKVTGCFLFQKHLWYLSCFYLLSLFQSDIFTEKFGVYFVLFF